MTVMPRDQSQVMSCDRRAENRERAAGLAWDLQLASPSEPDGRGDRAARAAAGPATGSPRGAEPV